MDLFPVADMFARFPFNMLPRSIALHVITQREERDVCIFIKYSWPGLEGLPAWNKPHGEED